MYLLYWMGLCCKTWIQTPQLVSDLCSPCLEAYSVESLRWSLWWSCNTLRGGCISTVVWRYHSTDEGNHFWTCGLCVFMDIEHSFLDIRKSKWVVHCFGSIKPVKHPQNLALIFHIRLDVYIRILILFDFKFKLIKPSSQGANIARHQSQETIV